MSVEIIGPVLFCVAFTFFVAGYIIGRKRGLLVNPLAGFARKAEMDAMVFGNGYLEIRRIDPTKVRPHVDPTRREKMPGRMEN